MTNDGFCVRATALLEAASYLVVGSCAGGRCALSLLVTRVTDRWRPPAAELLA